MMPAQSTQAEILEAEAVWINSYLEVGVQEGKSFRIVCEAEPEGFRATLVDTWGTVSGGSGRGNHDHILPLIPDGVEVEFIDEDSRTALPKLDDKFDLVHIDGDHSYDAALSDMEHGWRLCGKSMVVHDISFPEVWRAFFEFGQSLEPGVEVEVYFGGHGTAVVRR